MMEARTGTKPLVQRAAPRLRLAKGREDTSTEAIARVISGRIASRALPPGSRIVEQDICAEFSVARSAAREVLMMIQQRGLIVRPLNRSAMVIGFSKTDILEILDLREVLEGLCIRLATENTRLNSWRDMVELFEKQLGQAVAEQDWEAYLKTMQIFYRRARTACRSDKLCDLLEANDDRSLYVVQRIALLPGRMAQGYAELCQVVAAMHRGEAGAAEQLRRDNVRSQREWFVRYATIIDRL